MGNISGDERPTINKHALQKLDAKSKIKDDDDDEAAELVQRKEVFDY